MAKLDSRFLNNVFATDEEASSGVLNNKVITPKQLKTVGGNLPATTETAGIIRIATHIEAVLGTNSSATMNSSEMLPTIWNLKAK